MGTDCGMWLRDSFFYKTESGEKIVEVRLFDVKRQKLKVGNVIRFLKMSDAKDFVDTRIVGLFRFDSFGELFGKFGGNYYGKDVEYDVEDFIRGCRKYYSKEKELEFGVLAIKIEVIK